MDTYREQAKQLIRWHRERNYSIGEKFRLLERYWHLTDIEALETPLPLAVAQEIVAVEAGFQSWSALKASATNAETPPKPDEGEPKFCGVEFPQRLVRQAWGGLDFYVRDKDGNVVSFVQFRNPDAATVG